MTLPSTPENQAASDPGLYEPISPYFLNWDSAQYRGARTIIFQDGIVQIAGEVHRSKGNFLQPLKGWQLENSNHDVVQLGLTAVA